MVNSTVQEIRLSKQEAGSTKGSSSGAPVKSVPAHAAINDAQEVDVVRQEAFAALASSTAHDLNNVLAPVLISVFLLKERSRDLEDEILLRTIELSTKRCIHLVRQLLSFGRGLEPQLQCVDVAGLLSEAELIIRETLPRNIRVQIGTPYGLWSVQADPAHMQQVLLNVCSYARCTMPEGGHIRVSALNVNIDAQYSSMHADARVGPYVVVEVDDNGSGIDPDGVERMLNPSFATVPPANGVGLALATAFRIVKSHGGFIRVSSEVGKGSRYRIYLPADPSMSSSANDEVPETVLDGLSKLILVVDDNELVRSVTCQALESHGYRTLGAVNGAEAVAIFAMHSAIVDAVLIEMSIPVMDGPSTISALRVIRPDVCIIGCSGSAGIRKVIQAMGSGLRHFLQKPYTAEVLLRKLTEVLSE